MSFLMENFIVENVDGVIVLQIESTEKILKRKLTEMELYYAKESGFIIGFW